MKGSLEIDPRLKKSGAELLILSLLEARQRHGYELARQLEQQSGGVLSFHVASLYPLLYRLEERGWVEGRWVEKAGQRRRRHYSLTPGGRRVLATQREGWRSYVNAMNRVILEGPA